MALFPGSHSLARLDGHLEIQIRGAMDVGLIRGLFGKLRETFAGEPSPETVLFDLTEVERCDIAARQEMVGIQRFIATQGCRTAYLASRPRIRGITLWIVHISEDGNARPIVTLDEAEDWLGQESDRIGLAEMQATALT
ncbi:MAG TPA: hypothetical protein ENK31_01740, partial [Nannocystis exedens]|nr:hypothetical protein [Nannocystis exedens]